MSCGSLSTVIPPLRSGGLMLSYRCTNACAHCLYRCSPERPNVWMEREMLARILDDLAEERELSDIHIAGGEPTLNMDLLCHTIAACQERQISVSYVETNGWWCTTVEKGVAWFRRMADAGLRCVLISVSPFHNAFIPLRNTRACIDAAFEVFGSRGTFPYMAHLLDRLAALPEHIPHSLEAFCAAEGVERDGPHLPELYGLIPSGRAVEALRTCYPSRSADDFRGDSCARELLRTSHFHIDPDGHLFTGSCPGIVAGRVGAFHPEIRAECFPVMAALMKGGPAALMDVAMRDHGFVPDSEGYAGKCHLCLAVRTFLRQQQAFPELNPDAFYH